MLGGLIIYLTMLCMGELAVAIPISGSFVTYTSDFISPAVACGVGWSYWISWVAYIPAECVAGGILMEMFTGINGYLWAICFGFLITYINLGKVDTFGEIEFWLALIKIIALMCFVILAIRSYVLCYFSNTYILWFDSWQSAIGCYRISISLRRWWVTTQRNDVITYSHGFVAGQLSGV